jgi:gluconokinase
MHAGIPLTDEDRLPWLRSLNGVLREFASKQQSVVLACSALKDSYRAILQDAVPVVWVYLKGSPEMIRQRLHERHGHFAGEVLLGSQLATLEEPKDAMAIDADQPVDVVVEQILRRVDLT